LLDNMEFSQALDYIWNIISEDNKYIEEKKPWELSRSNLDRFDEVMRKLVADLYFISELIIPFMPETSEKIKKALNTKETNILFQRIKG
ncbi:MAG: methionine--tRNA ligase, partial [bacterium]|nr:methionine--tRNA ligase [bacterium]